MHGQALPKAEAPNGTSLANTYDTHIYVFSFFFSLSYPPLLSCIGFLT